VRCPDCDATNDDGAAFCASCAAPLTAYGAGVSGVLSPAAQRRAAELRVRPRAVYAAAALDAIFAVLPVGATVRALISRPALSEDATNYVSHAFGGLQAILAAAALLPIAAALLVLGWGVLMQRTWAWYANAAMLGVAVLVVIARARSMPAVAVVLLVFLCVLGYHWLQPPLRRWYGVE